MIVRSVRYDVRMIRTFEEAIEAVRMEVAPLIGDAVLFVSGHGREDADGYLVAWGVDFGRPLHGIVDPLPTAATFVDRRTGGVQITALAAEQDRIRAMSPVNVSVGSA